MIVNLNIKELRKDLTKICKIASMASNDYTSYLKLTAKNKAFYIDAINENRTQTLTVKLDETVCSVQENGSCCVQAKSFQQTVELMLGDTIELNSDDNSINLKSLPNSNQDEIQTIECISVDQWIDGNQLVDENIIEIYRNFFIDVGRFTSNSCSSDKSKAPLTAIHVSIKDSGLIQCTATDYVKISLYDCNNGIKDGVIEDTAFMLPVDVAKKIPQIFDKDIDVIQARIGSKKITLQAGNIRFNFATEVGVDRYPPLRDYLLNDMDVSCDVDLLNLIRISGLMSAVAPKSPCDIIFYNDKICFEAKEKRSKSKQFINVLPQSTIELPQDIKIAIYDLVTSLSIPDGEKISIGLTSIKNNSFGHLFEIRKKSDDIIWRQIILKARDEIPEENE